jgi:LPS sulfotransferase NodH
MTTESNPTAQAAGTPRPVSAAKTASYSNFRDPVGLVLRMLRSREPAARAALWRAGAEMLLAPLDWLLGGFESRRLRQVATDAPSLPQFLIVGAPRSGTTLVYQTLASRLPFSYFNNLSALFPRSVITISRLWPRPFVPPRGDARSYFGHTAGLRGVNEGLHVWNRWLGEDRNAAPRALDAQAGRDMRRFFAAWSQAFGGPLLNKSNRNGLCIGALADALPTAVFVVVKRNPLFTAQSLLRARKTIQGDEAEGWGVGAAREGRVPGADALADVADQVLYCDEVMRAQVQALPAGRVIEVSYEDFCRDPAGHVQRVWERLRAACPASLQLAPPRLEGLQPMQSTERAMLDEAQFERLRELLRAPRSLAGGAGPAP